MADNIDFDPAALLDTEYTGGLNTRLTPVPADDYRAQVKPGSVKVRKGTSKAGDPFVVADMMFLIDDPMLAEKLQLREPQVSASIFLEINPATKQLYTKEDNPNANTKLGQLKEACGFKEGTPWSLRAFEGRSCYIRVIQVPDEDDISTVYNRVTAFSKDPFKKKAA
jgi:hypothetical protein